MMPYTKRPSKRRNPVQYMTRNSTPKESCSGRVKNAGVGEEEIDTSATPNPFNIETNVIQNDGSTQQKVHAVSSQAVERAQKLIKVARGKGEERENHAIYKAIELLYGYCPRSGQQEALHHLIYKRRDLILIAKTAFGKSMLLQAISILLNQTITLVILPLQQIGVEQAGYIQRIGGRPYFLNSDTISPSVLSEIKKGKYTHILISPELAIGDKFRSVALNEGFQKHLCLVVIDEAHLVSLWGKSFRTSYAKLNSIRSIIGADIPWLACSATLDDYALNSLRKNVHFNDDVKIQRTSINRPEIVVRRGLIPVSKGVKALRFLFFQESGGTTPDEAYKSALDIPKTFVFFDSKKVAMAAVQEIRRWLQGSEHHGYTSADALQVVAFFHRRTSAFDKTRIIEKFQKPDSKLRVICATEALGMGVDVKNVRRTVQFSVHNESEIAVLWQRGGRSSRDRGNGEMIFLFPAWTKGNPVFLSRKGPNQSTEEPTGATRLTPEQRRGKLPDPIYQLINHNGCPREFFLDHFREPQEFRNSNQTSRCCDFHNPEYRLGDLSRFYMYQERGQSVTPRIKAVWRMIDAWVDRTSKEWFDGFLFPADAGSTAFLSTEERGSIAIASPNREDTQAKVEKWQYAKEYGEELVSFVCRAYLETLEYTQPKKPRRRVHQVQSSSSQMTAQSQSFSHGSANQNSQTFLLPMTPQSMSQPALYSQPNEDLQHINPVSQESPCFLSQQTQTIASPSLSKKGPKRNALQPIDGNRKTKRNHTKAQTNPQDSRKIVSSSNEENDVLE